MDQIILAFERENSSRRLKEILESAGITGTLICASADQVRRAVRKFRVSAVVCGHKLGDQSAEMLFCSPDIQPDRTYRRRCIRL